jgi:deoxyribodipyrimidine photo-lyase
MSALVWFRSDLRITDNRALHAACSQHSRVHAVFHNTPGQWALHGDAPVRVDFLRRAVASLTESLAAGGVPLHILHGDRFDEAPDRLAALAATLGARDLYFSAQHPVNERRRDAAVARRLREAGIGVHCLTDATLLPPGSLRTAGGGHYQVFTPFKRRLLAELTPAQRQVLPAPWALPATRPATASIRRAPAASPPTSPTACSPPGSASPRHTADPGRAQTPGSGS